MSGYLTRLLAGAVQPQRAVRPLLGPLFGWPSAGPEWLLRESRPRAKVDGDGVDAERSIDDGAVREDSPAVIPGRSPPRLVAAGSTPVGAVDPALRDPGTRARTQRGDGWSAGGTGRDEAHAQAARAQAAGVPAARAAAGEDAFGGQPELGDASNEARKHERSDSRVRPQALGRAHDRGHERGRERATRPRDAIQENAAPDDGAVAPLLDRWRPGRSTEIPWPDPAPAEPDAGVAGGSVRRSAALAPPTGEGDVPAATAAPVRIARLPRHRDGDMEPIRRYAPQPHDGSLQRDTPDRGTHPARAAEAMEAVDAMTAAVRPASPPQSLAGRDTGLLGAAVRRARPTASAQRHGVQNRSGVQNRYGAEVRHADPEPTVHVTIGTVEIKAAARSTPSRPRPASPAAPRLGLTEYLRRRRTGDPS